MINTVGFLDIVTTPAVAKQNMIDSFDRERYPQQWQIYQAAAPLRDDGMNTAQIAARLNEEGKIKSPRGHKLDKNHIARAIKRVETGRHA